MTNKIFSMVDGKRIGIASNLTSRLHRPDSVSSPCRCRVLTILLLCLTLFVGVGNAWGAGTTVTYTLTAKTTVSKSGTAPTGATATVTSTGSWYTNGSDGRKNTDQMAAGKNTVLTLSGFKGYKITGIVLNMCSNGSAGKGTFSAVAGSTTIASISSATNFNAWYDNTSYGTSRRDVNVSLTNSTYEIKQDEDVVITIACVTTNSLYISSWSITYEAVGGCSNSVAVTKGSESNGTITAITTSPIATCSATAADRRVTITVRPDGCYDAPAALTWTKSSGTVTATMQGSKTDNGDGTFSYVYQFAQNDNGFGTFGVTCTAKPAGKTVNFNAGPGVPASASLTEDCAGAGVTLPDVDLSGLCKGWTTFAGWATSAVSDSTTTSVTLYVTGDTYYPASDNMTLYAVYSKNKSGGSTSTTIAPEDLGVTSQNAIGTKTVGTITFKGELGNQGTSTNVPKYYSGSPNTIRCYASNDLTISSTNQISQIDFTYDGSYSGATPTPSVGSWAATPTTGWNQTWKGSSISIKFRIGNSQWRITNVKVTTGGGSTTYYCSDPNCCTQLGQINGSFS